MYTTVLSACMYMHELHWLPRRPEDSFGYIGTGITDGSKTPCGCWKLSPGSLHEQQVLLTPKACLYICVYIFLIT